MGAEYSSNFISRHYLRTCPNLSFSQATWLSACPVPLTGQLVGGSFLILSCINVRDLVEIAHSEPLEHST